MTCLVSPCLSSACPGQPDLACHVDYCQHCLAVFHDAHNNRLPCGQQELVEDIVGELAHLECGSQELERGVFGQLTCLECGQQKLE